MSCICFQNKNKLLLEHNAKLVITQSDSDHETCFVATEKIDKNNPQRIPLLPAEYCPFCGKLLKQ